MMCKRWIRCFCKVSFEKLFRFFLKRLEEIEKGEDKLICMIIGRMRNRHGFRYENLCMNPWKCVFLSIVLFLNQ